jgi:hypothetical protein
MSSGSRPVPLLGRPPRPLEHPGRYPGRPVGTKPWGARGQARLPRCWLRSRRGIHSRPGCWPRRPPRPLGRSDDQRLGQGLHGYEGRPGSGGWAAYRRQQPPQVRFRTVDGVRTRVRRQRWLAKPTVVLNQSRRKACTRSRRSGPGCPGTLAVEWAARRIRDNWQRQRAPAPAAGRFRVPTPRTAAIRLPRARGQ